MISLGKLKLFCKIWLTLCKNVRNTSAASLNLFDYYLTSIIKRLPHALRPDLFYPIWLKGHVTLKV